MKNRKSNLEPVEPVDPDAEKPEAPASVDVMGRPPTPTPPHHKPAARLGREAQAQIGQQLRDMYGKFLKEGVPPHIADLVHRLSEQE